MDEEISLVELKKYVTVKNLLELLFMTILYAMLDNVGGIKKYAVVLLACLFLFVFGRKKKWSLEALVCVIVPVVVYVLCGSFSALIAGNSQTSTIKIILYVLVPVVFAFSMYTFYGENMEHIVNMQFLGSVLGYAFFDAPYFAKIVHWESVYAFTFGLFVIYYAHQKKWKWCIPAFLFMIFAEKRIAILAVVMSLILMGILWFFRQNKKLVAAFWGIVSVAVYGYVYLIYSGIMEAFCWGANIDTNGRVEMYARMADEAVFSPIYFGRGLGIVEMLLEHWNVTAFANLHNDLLKFYIELGFVGLFLYLLSFGIMFYYVEKWFGKSPMCFFFGISVYTMILFATDNVSIYMIYLIPLYTVFFAALFPKKMEKKMKEKK